MFLGTKQQTVLGSELQRRSEKGRERILVKVPIHGTEPFCVAKVGVCGVGHIFNLDGSKVGEPRQTLAGPEHKIIGADADAEDDVESAPSDGGGSELAYHVDDSRASDSTRARRRGIEPQIEVNVPDGVVDLRIGTCRMQKANMEDVFAEQDLKGLSANQRTCAEHGGKGPVVSTGPIH